ncbi:MAG: NAD(P)H-dependent oxidoreductase subunit E [Clostridiales bacterium]|nr:NAD(P)H-dependent oxidoreductase subunit E [Clostridiales bacterium]
MAKRKSAVPFYMTQEQEAKLQEIIAEHRDIEGALLPVLQKAQELCGYVPIEVQGIIAEGLNLKLSQVAGTLSFYSLFQEEKCGRHIIRMCKSAPCHVKAAGKTLKAFEAILGIKAGETTSDGKFTLFTCECLGICDRSPAVMVDNAVFGPVPAEDVSGFLAQFV